MLAVIIFFILTLSTLSFAADENKQSPADNSAIGQEAPQEAPGDTFDGSEIDSPSPADMGKPMRMPTADGLPYTDDEIQNNLPEGYKTKNMPIDKD
jgi:hypothetical protein